MKDAPFLLLSLLVTLPLAPAAGIAPALSALAMGNQASMNLYAERLVGHASARVLEPFRDPQRQASETSLEYFAGVFAEIHLWFS